MKTISWVEILDSTRLSAGRRQLNFAGLQLAANNYTGLTITWLAIIKQQLPSAGWKGSSWSESGLVGSDVSDIGSCISISICWSIIIT
jgi:hypothetical protein